MRWVIGGMGLLFLVGGCTAKLKTQDEFQRLADAHHFALMEGENALVGAYLTTQEFNAGLKWECREPDAEPYPTLFHTLDSLKVLHDQALSNRGSYYQCREEQLKGYPEADAESKKRRVSAEAACFDFSRTIMVSLNHQYWPLQARYDSLCKVFNIRRITHGMYADSLGQRLVHWQDSLVEQGRLIGAGRSVVKKIQLPPSDSTFQRLYQPLSRMEKLHKEFQSQLILVENQLGRYESSRQDEYFYTGPHLVKHHDVEKTETEVRKLPGMMQEFRALHTTFTEQLSSFGLE